MRYRPFGKSGQVVSAVSLLLDGDARRSARDWRDLTGAALDLGVNTFELVGDAPALIEGVMDVLGEVERELLVIAWRPTIPAAAARTVEALLEHTGLQQFEIVMLDGPADAGLQTLRAERRIRAFGLAGDDDTADALIAAGGHQVLAAPYTPTSGWKERNRIKAAAARDMAVFAHDVLPEALRPKPAPILKKVLFRDKAHPLAGAGSYQFLDNTPGWTPEEICLAHVLTEPAVASVRVEPESPAHLQGLAETTERDLPAGVSAQIEMARFSVASA